MGTIKERNCEDLTEAEEIKKRWQEYTEEQYKKGLNDPDNHDGVITHPESDVPDCEVKRALGSIEQSWWRWRNSNWAVHNDDAATVLHLTRQQICETQQRPQDWKISVFIPIPKKDKAKECSNYRTIALISHASKVMLKIIQARVQQYVNQELQAVNQDVQARFRKGRGSRDQMANIGWIIQKAIELKKQTTHLLLLHWLG